MGLHTPRNTCLCCGRFWEEDKITGIREEMSKCCPYCADTYYCDNVQPNIPIPIAEHRIQCDTCNRNFIVETNDAKFCPYCKHGFVMNVGISQVDYQNMVLINLGI